MFYLVKQVYVEHHLFIAKMHIESAKNVIALKNLNAYVALSSFGAPLYPFFVGLCACFDKNYAK